MRFLISMVITVVKLRLMITEAKLHSKTKKEIEESHKGKKSEKKKRRRLQVDNADSNVPVEDDTCAELYEAAQAQLESDMKAAGMEGCLPLSFGGRAQSKASRKRKRPLLEESEQLGDGEAEDGREYDASKCEYVQNSDREKDVDGEEAQVEEQSPIVQTTVVDKVRVVYDSDGEVVDRVVEKVEIVEEVKPQDKNIVEIENQNANGKSKKKKTKYPVPKDVVKFYLQRHVLFDRFEDGIQLDHESWYSVTPQAIAEHIAKRLACDIVVDPFSGCGGNVIQLAKTCKQVIAIDIDPEKIRMAKHNAEIYGVADKIEFIIGNSIDILPKLKADVVFLSPPWGGMKYSRKRFSLEDMLVKGISGLDLFAKAQQVSKNIAYYLPKGTPTEDLMALTPDESVECEKIFLNKQLKVVTAYYGDLVAPASQIMDTQSEGQQAAGTNA